MSNKPKIKIGGVDHIVNYTFQSYVDMHESHGVNVFDLQTVTPKMILVIIWGAIVHAHPTITPEDIGNKISIEEAVLANRACTKAIYDGLPKKQEEKKDPVADVTA